MITYTFILDNTFNFGDPNGWNDLAIQYTFESNVIREDFSITLEYCELSHPGSYDYFETVKSDPCGEATLEIRRFEDGVFSGVTANAIIRTKDIETDCNRKAVSIALEKDSALKRLEEGQSETVCAPAIKCLDLWQYESGGTYLTDFSTQVNRCGATLIDILGEFSNIFGSSFANSPIINNGPYQPEITGVDIPVIAPGDMIVLQITSSLGSTFEVDVTAGALDTNITIAEKIANGLLCKDFDPDGYQMSLDEIVHRISCTDTNSNRVLITTDWTLDSINLFINGAPQAGVITQFQAFNYSLEDLHIFAEGMSNDDVCFTWQQTKNLLIGLFNAVMADTASGISIDTYENTFSTPPSVAVQDKRIIKGFDQPKLNRRGQFGSSFTIKSIDSTIDNWTWEGGGGPSDNITVITVGTPVVLTQTGIGKLSGQVCFTNSGGTTANFTYEFLLNGTVVASQPISLVPNQTTCFGIDDYFFATNPEDNRFCLAAGVDSFTVNPTAPGLPAGVSINIDTIITVDYSTPCINVFQGREDITISPTYSPFNDLLSCLSTFDKSISSDIYTGLGLAISQEIEGLHDYDDTYFAMIGNPVSGEAYKFERCLFFTPTDPDIPADCSCIAGQVISNYYYNMILQKPYILKFFQPSVPSDIEIDAFDFVTTIDSSGNYVCNQTEVVVTQPKIDDNLEVYTFDHCILPSEFDTLRTERNLLHQNCNGAQIQGVIKSMESYLKPRLTQITVEG